VASSAAEMRPPAAVSATEMVSWRDLSRAATSSAALLSGSGGKKKGAAIVFRGVFLVVVVVVRGKGEFGQGEFTVGCEKSNGFLVWHWGRD
jgi:hypothetical protein